MITVNTSPIEYRADETIAALLERLDYVWPMIVVKVNGQLVKRDAFAGTTITDGDTVEVIHMMSGG